MYISSRELLVLVIGTLEFSSIIPIEAHPNFFFDVIRPGKRCSILEEDLKKFTEIFYGRVRCRNKNLQIVFPNEKNEYEWGIIFKKQENGSYICKRDKIENLAVDFFYSHYYYPMMEVEKVLQEIGLIK